MPSGRLKDTIYSNFYHEFDPEVEKQLLGDPDSFAEHAAWDFYGKVWFDGVQWVEEVWRYRSVSAIFYGSSAKDVIEQAIANYGNR